MLQTVALLVGSFVGLLTLTPRESHRTRTISRKRESTGRGLKGTFGERRFFPLERKPDRLSRANVEKKRTGGQKFGRNLVSSFPPRGAEGEEERGGIRGLRYGDESEKRRRGRGERKKFIFLLPCQKKSIFCARKRCALNGRSFAIWLWWHREESRDLLPRGTKTAWSLRIQRPRKRE